VSVPSPPFSLRRGNLTPRKNSVFVDIAKNY
jgi:hypothetical protein